MNEEAQKTLFLIAEEYLGLDEATIAGERMPAGLSVNDVFAALMAAYLAGIYNAENT